MLPAFLLGLAVSDVFKRHAEEQRRFRIVSFAFLTPIFFLKGGLNVDVRYLSAGGGPLLGFLFVKIALKFVGVLPVALRYVRPHAVFTTLLMSTGLTFGNDLTAEEIAEVEDEEFEPGPRHVKTASRP